MSAISSKKFFRWSMATFGVAAVSLPFSVSADGISDANAGLIALNNGNNTEAVRLFTNALGAGLSRQDEELAYVKRAQAYFNQGQSAFAVADLERALAIDPNDSEAASFYRKLDAGPSKQTNDRWMWLGCDIIIGGADHMSETFVFDKRRSQLRYLSHRGTLYENGVGNNISPSEVVTYTSITTEPLMSVKVTTAGQTGFYMYSIDRQSLEIAMQFSSGPTQRGRCAELSGAP